MMASMIDILKGIGFIVFAGVLIVGFIRIVWDICTAKDNKPEGYWDYK